MASPELFRVFVAIYRAGSVSGAARERHLTQPAVSAQLAALERRVGEALFTRTPKGMTPTERGKALYAQVADSVDRLERVSRELRLVRPGTHRPLRLGCPPEFLHGHVIPRLAEFTQALNVTLGEARELLPLLEGGTLDAVLSSAAPPGRALTERPVAEVPFVLIGPPAWQPPALATLGEWLNARAWVSYSVELPVTRRFFAQVLGVRFAAPLALIAPDLRAVVRAAEVGLGASLTPLYAAQELLDAGRVRELLGTRTLIPPQQWRMVYRAADEDRAELQALAAALQKD